MSNLNFVPGQTVANLVTVVVGANGDLAVYTLSGATHVVMDVVGWYGVPDGPPGGRYVAATPERVLDTRGDSSVTCNPAGGAIGPAGTRTVQVTGCTGSAPSGATAVAVNVTVTQPSAAGMSPCSPGMCRSPRSRRT